MICVSIGDTNTLDVFLNENIADIAEIRLDLIKPLKEDIPGIFSRHPDKLIATCRPGYCSDARRGSLLKVAIESGAGWVDVEIDSEPVFMDEIINFAKSRKCKVILSYHNFTTTPSVAELEELTSLCFKRGGDIAKIACMANRTSDVARILSLYSKYTNLLALSMGEMGKISRIAALSLGAPFTYVSLQEAKSTAPGQMTLNEMKTILDILNI